MAGSGEAAEDGGWAVVEMAAEEARARFGLRLRAAYALGSLAHGGFAPLVSDVDVALVLHGRHGGDGSEIDELVGRLRRSGSELGRRLSVFWGDEDIVAGRTTGGRFPPLDRLDLIRYGVLVTGEDVRHLLPEPTQADLLAGAAQFTLTALASPAARRRILDGAHTASLGPRPASKTALFPVRFLFTARTGLIGENVAAVGDYVARSPPGPERDLAEAAVTWRSAWSPSVAGRAAQLLRAGSAALYRQFAATYVELLRDAGRTALAADLAEWSRALDP